MVKLPKLFAQTDQQWSTVNLGFNTAKNPDGSWTYTIGGYGCLITCLAMVSCYYKKNKNPKEINEALKSLGVGKGFTNGGFYVHGAFEKLYPDIDEVLTLTPNKLTDAQMNTIKNNLDDGYPVMVQVDSHPEDIDMDSHYVLLVNYDPNDENNFTIVDSYDGKEKSMKTYLRDTKTSFRIDVEQVYTYKGEVPVNDDSSLGFDHTKRLSDKLWELFNFDKAKGLPRKTSVDMVYKEYNNVVDELENRPDCADQIEAAVSKNTEALTEKHKEEVQKVTDDYLKEIDTLKANHLAEVELLKKYTSNPLIEGAKEVGRWALFGATSFVFEWLINALVPSLEMDATMRAYLLVGLTSFQRYVDKVIHERYLKVKAENAIVNAINFVEGRIVETTKKLPISGLSPF